MGIATGGIGLTSSLGSENNIYNFDGVFDDYLGNFVQDELRSMQTIRNPEAPFDGILTDKLTKHFQEKVADGGDKALCNDCINYIQYGSSVLSTDKYEKVKNALTELKSVSTAEKLGFSQEDTEALNKAIESLVVPEIKVPFSSDLTRKLVEFAYSDINANSPDALGYIASFLSGTESAETMSTKCADCVEGFLQSAVASTDDSATVFTQAEKTEINGVLKSTFGPESVGKTNPIDYAKSLRDDSGATRSAESQQLKDRSHLVNGEHDAVNDIIDQLYAEKRITDGMSDEEMSEAILEYVQQNFNYESDGTDENGDLKDHWQSIDETLANGSGDCEDLSILQGSLMMNALQRRGYSRAETRDMVKLTAGYVTDDQGVKRGHMFVTMKNDRSGDVMAFDATSTTGPKTLEETGMDVVLEFNDMHFQELQAVDASFTTALQVGDLDLSGTMAFIQQDFTALNALLRAPIETPRIQGTDVFRSINETQLESTHANPLPDSVGAINDSFYLLDVRTEQLTKITDLTQTQLDALTVTTTGGTDITYDTFRTRVAALRSTVTPLTGTARQNAVNEVKAFLASNKIFQKLPSSGTTKFTFFDIQHKSLRDSNHDNAMIPFPIFGTIAGMLGAGGAPSPINENFLVAELNPSKLFNYVNEAMRRSNRITSLYYIVSTIVEASELETEKMEMDSIMDNDTYDAVRKSKRQAAAYKSKIGGALNQFLGQVSEATQEISGSMIEYVRNVNSTMQNAVDMKIQAYFRENISTGIVTGLLDEALGIFELMRTDAASRLQSVVALTQARNTAHYLKVTQLWTDNLQTMTSAGSAFDHYNVDIDAFKNDLQLTMNELGASYTSSASLSNPGQLEYTMNAAHPNGTIIAKTQDGHRIAQVSSLERFRSFGHENENTTGSPTGFTTSGGVTSTEGRILHAARGEGFSGGAGFVDINQFKLMTQRDWLTRINMALKAHFLIDQSILETTLNELGSMSRSEVPQAVSSFFDAASGFLNAEIGKHDAMFDDYIGAANTMAENINALVSAQYQTRRAWVKADFKMAQTSVFLTAIPVTFAAASTAAKATVTGYLSGSCPGEATTAAAPFLSAGPAAYSSAYSAAIGACITTKGPPMDLGWTAFYQFNSMLQVSYSTDIAVKTRVQLLESAELRDYHHNQHLFNQAGFSGNNVFDGSLDNPSDTKKVVDYFLGQARGKLNGLNGQSRIRRGPTEDWQGHHVSGFVTSRGDGGVALDGVALARAEEEVATLFAYIRALIIVEKTLLRTLIIETNALSQSQDTGLLEKFEQFSGDVLYREQSIHGAYRSEIHANKGALNTTHNKYKAEIEAGFDLGSTTAGASTLLAAKVPNLAPPFFPLGTGVGENLYTIAQTAYSLTQISLKTFTLPTSGYHAGYHSAQNQSRSYLQEMLGGSQTIATTAHDRLTRQEDAALFNIFGDTHLDFQAPSDLVNPQAAQQAQQASQALTPDSGSLDRTQVESEITRLNALLADLNNRKTLTNSLDTAVDAYIANPTPENAAVVSNLRNTYIQSYPTLLHTPEGSTTATNVDSLISGLLLGTRSSTEVETILGGEETRVDTVIASTTTDLADMQTLLATLSSGASTTTTTPSVPTATLDIGALNAIQKATDNSVDIGGFDVSEYIEPNYQPVIDANKSLAGIFIQRNLLNFFDQVEYRALMGAIRDTYGVNVNLSVVEEFYSVIDTYNQGQLKIAESFMHEVMSRIESYSSKFFTMQQYTIQALAIGATAPLVPLIASAINDRAWRWSIAVVAQQVTQQIISSFLHLHVGTSAMKNQVDKMPRGSSVLFGIEGTSTSPEENQEEADRLARLRTRLQQHRTDNPSAQFSDTDVQAIYLEAYAGTGGTLTNPSAGSHLDRLDQARDHLTSGALTTAQVNQELGLRATSKTHALEQISEQRTRITDIDSLDDLDAALRQDQNRYQSAAGLDNFGFADSFKENAQHSAGGRMIVDPTVRISQSYALRRKARQEKAAFEIMQQLYRTMLEAYDGVDQTGSSRTVNFGQLRSTISMLQQADMANLDLMHQAAQTKADNYNKFVDLMVKGITDAISLGLGAALLLGLASLGTSSKGQGAKGAKQSGVSGKKLTAKTAKAASKKPKILIFNFVLALMKGLKTGTDTVATIIAAAMAAEAAGGSFEDANNADQFEKGRDTESAHSQLDGKTGSASEDSSTSTTGSTSYQQQHVADTIEYETALESIAMSGASSSAKSRAYEDIGTMTAMIAAVVLVAVRNIAKGAIKKHIEAKSQALYKEHEKSRQGALDALAEDPFNQEALEIILGKVQAGSMSFDKLTPQQQDSVKQLLDDKQIASLDDLDLSSLENRNAVVSGILSGAINEDLSAIANSDSKSEQAFLRNRVAKRSEAVIKLQAAAGAEAIDSFAFGVIGERAEQAEEFKGKLKGVAARANNNGGIGSDSLDVLSGARDTNGDLLFTPAQLDQLKETHAAISGNSFGIIDVEGGATIAGVSEPRLEGGTVHENVGSELLANTKVFDSEKQKQAAASGLVGILKKFKNRIHLSKEERLAAATELEEQGSISIEPVGAGDAGDGDTPGEDGAAPAPLSEEEEKALKDEALLAAVSDISDHDLFKQSNADAYNAQADAFLEEAKTSAFDELSNQRLGDTAEMSGSQKNLLKGRIEGLSRADFDQALSLSDADIEQIQSGTLPENSPLANNFIDSFAQGLDALGVQEASPELQRMVGAAATANTGHVNKADLYKLKDSEGNFIFGAGSEDQQRADGKLIDDLFRDRTVEAGKAGLASSTKGQVVKRGVLTNEFQAMSRENSIDNLKGRGFTDTQAKAISTYLAQKKLVHGDEKVTSHFLKRAKASKFVDSFGQTTPELEHVVATQGRDAAIETVFKQTRNKFSGRGKEERHELATQLVDRHISQQQTKGNIDFVTSAAFETIGQLSEFGAEIDKDLQEAVKVSEELNKGLLPQETDASVKTVRLSQKAAEDEGDAPHREFNDITSENFDFSREILTKVNNGDDAVVVAVDPNLIRGDQDEAAFLKEVGKKVFGLSDEDAEQVKFDPVFDAQKDGLINAFDKQRSLTRQASHTNDFISDLVSPTHQGGSLLETATSLDAVSDLDEYLQNIEASSRNLMADILLINAINEEIEKLVDKQKDGTIRLEDAGDATDDHEMTARRRLAQERNLRYIKINPNESRSEFISRFVSEAKSQGTPLLDDAALTQLNKDFSGFSKEKDGKTTGTIQDATPSGLREFAAEQGQQLSPAKAIALAKLIQTADALGDDKKESGGVDDFYKDFASAGDVQNTIKRIQDLQKKDPATLDHQEERLVGIGKVLGITAKSKGSYADLAVSFTAARNQNLRVLDRKLLERRDGKATSEEFVKTSRDAFLGRITDNKLKLDRKSLAMADNTNNALIARNERAVRLFTDTTDAQVGKGHGGLENTIRGISKTVAHKRKEIFETRRDEIEQARDPEFDSRVAEINFKSQDNRVSSVVMSGINELTMGITGDSAAELSTRTSTYIGAAAGLVAGFIAGLFVSWFGARLITKDGRDATANAASKAERNTRAVVATGVQGVQVGAAGVLTGQLFSKEGRNELADNLGRFYKTQRDHDLIDMGHIARSTAIDLDHTIAQGTSGRFGRFRSEEVDSARLRESNKVVVEDSNQRFQEFETAADPGFVNKSLVNFHAGSVAGAVLSASKHDNLETMSDALISTAQFSQALSVLLDRGRDVGGTISEFSDQLKRYGLTDDQAAKSVVTVLQQLKNIEDADKVTMAGSKLQVATDQYLNYAQHNGNANQKNLSQRVVIGLADISKDNIVTGKALHKKSQARISKYFLGVHGLFDNSSKSTLNEITQSKSIVGAIEGFTDEQLSQFEMRLNKEGGKTAKKNLFNTLQTAASQEEKDPILARKAKVALNRLLGDPNKKSVFDGAVDRTTLNQAKENAKTFSAHSLFQASLDKASAVDALPEIQSETIGGNLKEFAERNILNQPDQDQSFSKAFVDALLASGEFAQKIETGLTSEDEDERKATILTLETIAKSKGGIDALKELGTELAFFENSDEIKRVLDVELGLSRTPAFSRALSDGFDVGQRFLSEKSGEDKEAFRKNIRLNLFNENRAFQRELIKLDVGFRSHQQDAYFAQFLTANSAERLTQLGEVIGKGLLIDRDTSERLIAKVARLFEDKNFELDTFSASLHQAAPLNKFRSGEVSFNDIMVNRIQQHDPDLSDTPINRIVHSQSKAATVHATETVRTHLSPTNLKKAFQQDKATGQSINKLTAVRDFSDLIRENPRKAATLFTDFARIDPAGANRMAMEVGFRNMDDVGTKTFVDLALGRFDNLIQAEPNAENREALRSVERELTRISDSITEQIQEKAKLAEENRLAAMRQEEDAIANQAQPTEDGQENQRFSTRRQTMIDRRRTIIENINRPPSGSPLIEADENPADATAAQRESRTPSQHVRLSVIQGRASVLEDHFMDQETLDMIQDEAKALIETAETDDKELLEASLNLEDFEGTKIQLIGENGPEDKSLKEFVLDAIVMPGDYQTSTSAKLKILETAPPETLAAMNDRHVDEFLEKVLTSQQTSLEDKTLAGKVLDKLLPAKLSEAANTLSSLADQLDEISRPITPEEAERGAAPAPAASINANDQAKLAEAKNSLTLLYFATAISTDTASHIVDVSQLHTTELDGAFARLRQHFVNNEDGFGVAKETAETLIDTHRQFEAIRDFKEFQSDYERITHEDFDRHTATPDQIRDHDSRLEALEEEKTDKIKAFLDQSSTSTLNDLAKEDPRGFLELINYKNNLPETSPEETHFKRKVNDKIKETDFSKKLTQLPRLTRESLGKLADKGSFTELEEVDQERLTNAMLSAELKPVDEVGHFFENTHHLEPHELPLYRSELSSDDHRDKFDALVRSSNPSQAFEALDSEVQDDIKRVLGNHNEIGPNSNSFLTLMHFVGSDPVALDAISERVMGMSKADSDGFRNKLSVASEKLAVEKTQILTPKSQANLDAAIKKMKFKDFDTNTQLSELVTESERLLKNMQKEFSYDGKNTWSQNLDSMRLLLGAMEPFLTNGLGDAISKDEFDRAMSGANGDDAQSLLDVVGLLSKASKEVRGKTEDRELRRSLHNLSAAAIHLFTHDDKVDKSVYGGSLKPFMDVVEQEIYGDTSALGETSAGDGDPDIESRYFQHLLRRTQSPLLQTGDQIRSFVTLVRDNAGKTSDSQHTSSEILIKMMGIVRPVHDHATGATPLKDKSVVISTMRDGTLSGKTWVDILQSGIDSQVTPTDTPIPEGANSKLQMTDVRALMTDAKADYQNFFLKTVGGDASMFNAGLEEDLVILLREGLRATNGEQEVNVRDYVTLIGRSPQTIGSKLFASDKITYDNFDGSLAAFSRNYDPERVGELTQDAFVRLTTKKTDLAARSQIHRLNQTLSNRDASEAEKTQALAQFKTWFIERIQSGEPDAVIARDLGVKNPVINKAMDEAFLATTGLEEQLNVLTNQRVENANNALQRPDGDAKRLNTDIITFLEGLEVELNTPLPKEDAAKDAAKARRSQLVDGFQTWFKESIETGNPLLAQALPTLERNPRIHAEMDKFLNANPDMAAKLVDTLNVPAGDPNLNHNLLDVHTSQELLSNRAVYQAVSKLPTQDTKNPSFLLAKAIVTDPQRGGADAIFPIREVIEKFPTWDITTKESFLQRALFTGKLTPEVAAQLAEFPGFRNHVAHLLSQPKESASFNLGIQVLNKLEQTPHNILNAGTRTVGPDGQVIRETHPGILGEMLQDPANQDKVVDIITSPHFLYTREGRDRALQLITRDLAKAANKEQVDRPFTFDVNKLNTILESKTYTPTQGLHNIDGFGYESAAVTTGVPRDVKVQLAKAMAKEGLMSSRENPNIGRSTDPSKNIANLINMADGVGHIPMGMFSSLSTNDVRDAIMAEIGTETDANTILAAADHHGIIGSLQRMSKEQPELALELMKTQPFSDLPADPVLNQVIKSLMDAAFSTHPLEARLRSSILQHEGAMDESKVSQKIADDQLGIVQHAVTGKVLPDSYDAQKIHQDLTSNRIGRDRQSRERYLLSLQVQPDNPTNDSRTSRRSFRRSTIQTALPTPVFSQAEVTALLDEFDRLDTNYAHLMTTTESLEGMPFEALADRYERAISQSMDKGLLQEIRYDDGNTAVVDPHSHAETLYDTIVKEHIEDERKINTAAATTGKILDSYEQAIANSDTIDSHNLFDLALEASKSPANALDLLQRLADNKYLPNLMLQGRTEEGRNFAAAIALLKNTEFTDPALRAKAAEASTKLSTRMYDIAKDFASHKTLKQSQFVSMMDNLQDLLSENQYREINQRYARNHGMFDSVHYRSIAAQGFLLAVTSVFVVMKHLPVIYQIVPDKFTQPWDDLANKPWVSTIKQEGDISNEKFQIRHDKLKALVDDVTNPKNNLEQESKMNILSYYMENEKSRFEILSLLEEKDPVLHKAVLLDVLRKYPLEKGASKNALDRDKHDKRYGDQGYRYYSFSRPGPKYMLKLMANDKKGDTMRHLYNSMDSTGADKALANTLNEISAQAAREGKTFKTSMRSKDVAKSKVKDTKLVHKQNAEKLKAFVDEYNKQPPENAEAWLNAPNQRRYLELLMSVQRATPHKGPSTAQLIKPRRIMPGVSAKNQPQLDPTAATEKAIQKRDAQYDSFFNLLADPSASGMSERHAEALTDFLIDRYPSALKSEYGQVSFEGSVRPTEQEEGRIMNSANSGLGITEDKALESALSSYLKSTGRVEGKSEGGYMTPRPVAGIAMAYPKDSARAQDLPAYAQSYLKYVNMEKGSAAYKELPLEHQEKIDAEQTRIGLDKPMFKDVRQKLSVPSFAYQPGQDAELDAFMIYNGYVKVDPISFTYLTKAEQDGFQAKVKTSIANPDVREAVITIVKDEMGETKPDGTPYTQQDYFAGVVERLTNYKPGNNSRIDAIMVRNNVYDTRVGSPEADDRAKSEIRPLRLEVEEKYLDVPVDFMVEGVSYDSSLAPVLEDKTGKLQTYLTRERPFAGSGATIRKRAVMNAVLNESVRNGRKGSPYKSPLLTAKASSTGDVVSTMDPEMERIATDRLLGSNTGRVPINREKYDIFSSEIKSIISTLRTEQDANGLSTPEAVHKEHRHSAANILKHLKDNHEDIYTKIVSSYADNVVSHYAQPGNEEAMKTATIEQIDRLIHQFDGDDTRSIAGDVARDTAPFPQPIQPADEAELAEVDGDVVDTDDEGDLADDTAPLLG